MVMEIVSPISFFTTFMKAPFVHPPASHSSVFLASLYLTHYANRAVICPLRSPSRSRSHIIVTLIGIIFNLLNSFLMGFYLSSPDSISTLNSALSSWTFWTGLALWAFGFFGNVIHDEVLLELRRNHKRKAKQAEGRDNGKEYYAIPYGFLYRYISYPNYFCEWIEWFGFALAASPNNIKTPPWLFFMGEVLTMIPRAWRGHQWYHQKFPDYPKERKIIIPFLL
jgi:3-oxo-5-alpha-steroid 4-dehydrogenase 1